MSNNYIIQNRSTNKTGSIEGVDYNASIGGDDYVSYLPDIEVNSSGEATPVTGTRIFSRKINSDGEIVYNVMSEKTYYEYILDDPYLDFI